MSITLKSSVFCKPTDLNLRLTLLGGQSFRWKEIKDSAFVGTFRGKIWKLKMLPECNKLEYEVFYENKSGDCIAEKDFNNMISNYFRLNFDLEAYYKIWRKNHSHFNETSKQIKAVRVLDQEPFENIISFICSQNNNITRISLMVQTLCKLFGNRIGSYDKRDFFSFPTIEALATVENLEDTLRKEKFGYRAKMISNAVKQILNKGGEIWFEKLKLMEYKIAKEELLTVSGIGPKVADCICLMSLGKLESVPIDRHIFKIAQDHYMPELKKVKLSPKQYELVAKMYRETYGEYAGWAQAVLFCSGIQK
ncbi:N-glycosylase/DNA lyase [Condylostylus longicornis]|uniref:N-glycosylase/DNA lyase n=1 Tax=Condylostylus longicornis TaxID=2530218 RepID=UPI00244DC3C2|nr:N-glycosylase/DNA lyase [Condylostylus longicornis]